MAYGQQTMGVFLGSLWPSISVGWASVRPTPGTGGNSRMLSLIQYFRYVRDFRSSLATQTIHTVVYWVILRSTTIHILFVGLVSFPGSSQSTKVGNETTRSSMYSSPFNGALLVKNGINLFSALLLVLWILG